MIEYDNRTKIECTSTRKIEWSRVSEGDQAYCRCLLSVSTVLVFSSDENCDYILLFFIFLLLIILLPQQAENIAAWSVSCTRCSVNVFNDCGVYPR